MTMIERYARAIGCAGPKVAATTPGLAVEGYWLDESRYFFLAERIEPTLGRLMDVPSLAHADTGVVEEVVPLTVLTELLSTHADQAVDLQALAGAAFDMPDASTLAVSMRGQTYLVDRHRRRVTVACTSLDVPALYSPDGRHACFVREHDLWLRELSTGAERQLTNGGMPDHSYGQQPQSCLAAVTYRQCPSPMGLWSPDSQWFLTHRIDERAVPELALVQHAPPGGARPKLHRYRHPFPGDPLPMVTYVAIHIASGRLVAFDEFPTPALTHSPFYRFRRAAWFSGPSTAWFLRMDRYWKQAELIQLDLATASARVVLRESVQSGYFESNQLHGAWPNVRTLDSSGEVIWFSERDGWGHLYLYEMETGALKHQVTRGEWLVRDVVHVDEKRRTVLFTACGVDSRADPARRTLCRIDLDGSDFAILCRHEGDAVVPKTGLGTLEQDRRFRPPGAPAGISPDGRFGVVRYASVARGNETQVLDLETRRGFVIASAQPAAHEVLPRPFYACAADGTTRIHGVMFLPSDFDDSARYPLVDFIYPGPQITQQPQSFRAMNAAQARALAELGFVTIMLDTRGVPCRSRDIHQLGYGNLHEPQLADHAAAIRQLCDRHAFIDAERVGIFGQSGGGFATARALLDYGAVFKVGVSVCGNHDATYGLATWSDKYRGPPDPESWLPQANGAVAHKLNGKLLMIAGDMDENVHASQTLLLVDALVRANRDFDLLIVPNEGHDLLMTNGYVLRRVWDYFVRHLLAATPPRDVQITFEPDELARMRSNWLREIFQ